MYYFFSLISTVCIFFCLLSCGRSVEQFSKKEPYAIELRKVRSFYEAEAITERLADLGLEPYLILLQDEDNANSKWFSVMMGAEADLKEVAILQGVVEDVTKLEETTVINFNDIADRLEDFDADKYDEAEKIIAYDPDIPNDISELINKFPSDNSLTVDYMSMHNFPLGNNSRSLRQGFYDAKLDLPRGVSKKLIASNVRSFAEVIFKDNLYGDQVTIEIMKMRTDGSLHQNLDESINEKDKSLAIANQLANKILNTGRYRREEMDEISVESFVPLKGYKVLIEPRKDYLRTYMILIDETSEFAIFSQSTAKTDDEILSYLKGFGKSEGMLAYNEFYNTFYTIPKCLQNGDVFIGYSSSILNQNYARSRNYANWAKAMVGHSQSTAYFYNCLVDKSWSAAAFDLLTPTKKDYIYGDMYANAQYANKYPLKVNEQNGYFVREPSVNYNEVNFSTSGRHVMAIGGIGMTKEQLHSRAATFQPGDKLKEDLCDEKYYLTFWASMDFMSGNPGSPGHAFVSYAREDHENQMTKSDGAWGFYPENYGGDILDRISSVGEVPGTIVDDIKEGSPRDLGYTILVSKEEYEQALKIKEEWNTKTYQLTVNDCITFVEAVAASIDGLKVPKRSKIFNKLQLQSVDLGLVELPVPALDYQELIYFPKVFLSELISVNEGNGRDLCQL